jgi:HEAT repeat protein
VAKLREEVHNMYQLVTISLLQQQSASERLRGLSWSQRVSQPDPEVLSALLQVLNYDPNVNVRLAAVDALSQFSGQQNVRQGLIQGLTRQASPLVQIALIDLLVSLHERNSVDTLKHLVKDQRLNESVKQRAEWGLKQLS